MAAQAQMAINTDGSLPDNSAMLEVKSSSKGLLIPSMTIAQRNAVPAPANGLMVFQTDNSPGFYYNSGSSINPSWALTGTLGGWNLNGNSGLNLETDFLGTTDNNAFSFRVSNLAAGIIDPLKNNTGFGKQSLLYSSTGNYNTAFGSSALAGNTSGQYNSSFGYSSASLNISGSENTSLGANPLSANTSGNRNLAAGYFSMAGNTTGNSNIAVGVRALYTNTTRNCVVAVGDSSLFFNGTNATQPDQAMMNSAVGSMALSSNTTGFGNTTAGRFSLANNTNGNSNTVLGTKASFFNITGSNNTAIGLISLYYSTSGSGNTAFGFGSLYNNTEGSDNTIVGMLSGFNSTTGCMNTGLGYYSLVYNISGTGNTSLGQQSLASNVSGNYNTAVGIYALGYTYSDYNTGVGYNSGGGYSFDRSTFMGAHAYPEGNSFTNCLAMGIDARVDASNKYVIGKWSVTSIGGYANWTTFSDGRFKKNVSENVPGLVFINRLRPVTNILDAKELSGHFDRSNNSELFSGNPKVTTETLETCKDGIVFTGFIAEEVMKAATQVNYNFSGIDVPVNENGFYRLRYEEFVVPLVKAIQELNQRKEANIEAIRKLKQRIENLENK
jgi:trimeric autotransporter adhesin